MLKPFPFVRLRLLVAEKQLPMVTDQLLTLTPEEGFQVFEVQSYHQQHALDNSAEQVAGYLPKFTVEVQVEIEQLTDVMAHIRHALPQGNIAYQVLPVLDSGQL